MTAQSARPVSPPPTAADRRIHVMLVDDSAVIRGMMHGILASDERIAITASAANGRTALQLLRSMPIDVIVLDLEMPVMGGLDAVPRLLEVNPSVKIIIASSLSRRGAEISLRALELGAVDYVPKPVSRRDIGVDGAFRRELLTKVKSHGGRRSVSLGARAAADPSLPPAPPLPRRIDLRQSSPWRPWIVAIGSSTGGPQALFSLLRDLPRDLGVPIVITQHMPPTFTTVLAQHVSRLSERRCEEAADGAALDPACIYIAPGDHHLLVEWTGTKFHGRLTQDLPENHCRPSVDPMLRSLARGPANRVLALMLTGMGSDGLAGIRQLIEAGGTCLAQDEASSIVWGMPGAVATAGLCAAVLPLPQMASHIVQLFEAGAP